MRKKSQMCPNCLRLQIWLDFPFSWERRLYYCPDEPPDNIIIKLWPKVDQSILWKSGKRKNQKFLICTNWESNGQLMVELSWFYFFLLLSKRGISSRLRKSNIKSLLWTFIFLSNYKKDTLFCVYSRSSSFRMVLQKMVNK